MAPELTAKFHINLSGHAAIVTGGGTEIGRACALAFAQSGAAVCVNDLNPDGADSVTAEIKEAGGRAIAWQGDISNRFQVAAMIENARDAFGRISILVNAASVFRDGPLDKLDEWDWRRILDVNLTGAFFCTQLIGRVMADEGGGSIVNIAANAGHGRTLPDGISYVASKAGMIGLTQQSARELAPQNIRVNAVCPGNLVNAYGQNEELPQNMLARRGTDAEVADVVLFLCSDAARFITGQAIDVDGGGL
ncbi:MAG: short-chain dehydrogenase/reductase SDR [Chloroflexi bacterium OLB15]|nr:MAG: short-chain dehydrogenase/reductase SDR [Chloroflexi bacterium OLB15]